MYKFLILTDSIGNPRRFPVSGSTMLEETYPYLLRAEFSDSIFYQLSFGNVTTERLTIPIMGYLSHWHPDIVIVQSGIIDCRPEGFTEFEKFIIESITKKIPDRIPIIGNLRKHLRNPKMVEKRQKYRVTKNSFYKTLKRFKLIFPKAEIFWVEIFTSRSGGYEKAKPGVLKRIRAYNKIIQNAYGENVIKVQDALNKVDGMCTDHLHLNKRGHEAVAKILIERIKLSLSPVRIDKI